MRRSASALVWGKLREEAERTLGGREIPARLSVRQTVACGCPVSPAISRGPQPLRRLAAQIRACSAIGNSRGQQCGHDERSSRQASERRCWLLASDQRCHHMQAVVGEAPWRLAASLLAEGGPSDPVELRRLSDEIEANWRLLGRTSRSRS